MLFDAERWFDTATYCHSKDLDDALFADAENFNAQCPHLRGNYEANRHLVNGDNLLSQRVNEWCGEAVVVVGAGASAMDNIKFLRNAQPQFRVIVVDRAYQRLRDEGIKPDIVLSLDASPAIGDFLTNVDADCEVAMCVTQNPDAVKSVKDKCKKLWFYSLVNPYDKELVRIHKENPGLAFLRAGVVVGYSAADLAYWMTSGNEQGGGYIVLLGNELGWKSMSELEADSAFYKGRILLETVLPSGKPFYTMTPFAEAGVEFQNMMNVYKDAVFVNASGGLAWVTHEMDFQTAIEMEVERNNMEAFLEKAGRITESIRKPELVEVG